MTINLLTGLLAVLLGAAYSVQAWNLPRATMGNPIGPMVFPLILGGGMVLMGGLLLLQEWIARKAGREGKKANLTLGQYGRSIALVTGFCVGYVVLFERLGYVLSTFLFLASVLWLFNGKTKWKSVLILASGFSLGVYLLFGSVLNIQLPRMPLVGF